MPYFHRRWLLSLFLTLPGWPACLLGDIDVTPPQGTILSINPPTVDVSLGEQTTTVRVRVIDDVSGFSSGSVTVGFEDTALKWFFDTNSLVQGDPRDGIYDVPITLPIGSPPGPRDLRVITFDKQGRASAQSSNQTITVVNNGLVDMERPVIHSLTIRPRVLDLTSGGGSVTLTMEVSDDATGISTIFGDLIPPIPDFSPDTRKFVWYHIAEGSERVTLTSTYPLGPYSPAGEWRLEFEEFWDGVLRGNLYDFANPDLYTAFPEAAFTVINPNEDRDPPVLESVVFPDPVADTSYSEDLIPYSVRFRDPDSGAQSISVRLHPPSGGREIYAYRRAEEGLSSGDARNGTIDGIFLVPRFIEEGEWKVSVRLRDEAGFYINYGHGSNNPLPPGSTASVSVTNETGSDQEDLEITAISITPDPVDVTERSQTVHVDISFRDNLSGLDYISLRILSPDEAFSEWPSLDVEELISGTLQEGTVRTSFQIPRYTPPGQWFFKSARLRDNAGNYESLVSPPLFVGGIANGFQVVNNGIVDTDPPQFVDMTLLRNTADVSAGNAWLPIRLTATDDVSGIEDAIVRYRQPDTRKTISFFLSDNDLIASNGLTVTLEDEGLVQQFMPPGIFFLEDIELEDRLGRQFNYGENEDAPLPPGLPDRITVVNNGPVDTEDPVITGIRLSETTFDISDFARFVTIEIDFTDDVAGLEDVDITLRHEDKPAWYYLIDTLLSRPELPPITGSPQSGSVRFLAEIPQFLEPGLWNVSYELTDHARNSDSFSGDEVPADTGSIEIINTGDVDRLDPKITDITLSADSVDVTDLAQTLTVSVGFRDDVSGMQEINFYMDSPSGTELLLHEVTEAERIQGDPVEGTYQFDITIPAFSEAGEWSLKVFVRDRVGNLDFPDRFELEAAGLTASFQVENRQPADYLWKGTEAYPDGWRKSDWFGWVQDRETHPFVYHLEHGWIFTSGTDLEQFLFYDLATGIWWWVFEDYYPYLYASSGTQPGWYYYYAPFGSPGNRWFHRLATATDLIEADL